MADDPAVTAARIPWRYYALAAWPIWLMTAGAFFAAWWVAGMTGVWMWLFGMLTQRILGPSWQVLTDFREGRRPSRAHYLQIGGRDDRAR